MALTTPGCPVSESLPAEAGQTLESALGIPVQVVVVPDPPWTPERIDLNRQALEQLTTEKRLAVVPGATHLFEEPGALDQVAAPAGDWFIRHLRHQPCG